MKRRTRAIFLATVLACALGGGALGYLAGYNQIMNGFVFDVALAARAYFDMERHRDTQEAAVAVVAIDAESLDREPFSRAPRALLGPVWGEIIDGLGNAGARVIAFDILFPYSGNSFAPGHDTSFLSALSKHRDKVVLGRSAATLPARSYLGALRFDEAVLGLLELPADSDGIYRRVPTRFQTGDGRMLPTLLGATVARAGATAERGEVLLGPRQRPETLPTYRAADVLTCIRDDDEKTLSRLFASKVIFIGTTLPEEDRKRPATRYMPATESDIATPIGDCALARFSPVAKGATTIPGVYVHASATNIILSNEEIAPSPGSQPAAVAAASAAIAALLAVTAPLIVAIVGTLLVIIAAFALQVWMLDQAIWLPVGAAIASAIGSVAVGYIARYFAADRRRKQLRNAFGHYLAPQIVERLSEDASALALGGRRTDATVMFVDLTGFTAASEVLSAEALVSATNAYLSVLADAVDHSGGYVDKFIGDAIMALWGVPAADPEHARHAAEAALGMRDAVIDLQNRSEREEGVRFDIKVGLNSGELIAGNVGSQRRMNYTAVGEVVNLASRLEGLCSVYGARIICGPETTKRIESSFILRELDRVAVKGKKIGVAIYELRERSENMSAADKSLLADYALALEAYRNRNFALAEETWNRHAAQDPPSALMAKRALAYMSNPPDMDWDGVFVMETK